MSPTWWDSSWSPSGPESAGRPRSCSRNCDYLERRLSVQLTEALAEYWHGRVRASSGGRVRPRGWTASSRSATAAAAIRSVTGLPRPGGPGEVVRLLPGRIGVTLSGSSARPGTVHGCADRPSPRGKDTSARDRTFFTKRQAPGGCRPPCQRPSLAGHRRRAACRPVRHGRAAGGLRAALVRAERSVMARMGPVDEADQHQLMGGTLTHSGMRAQALRPVALIGRGCWTPWSPCWPSAGCRHAGRRRAAGRLAAAGSPGAGRPRSARSWTRSSPAPAWRSASRSARRTSPEQAGPGALPAGGGAAGRHLAGAWCSRIRRAASPRHRRQAARCSRCRACRCPPGW